MIFARKVWHLLVAIKDGLALLFLLLFFLLLYAVMAGRPAPAAVREGALLLKLNGSIVEEPAEVDPLQALLSQSLPASEYRARDLIKTLRAAAKDDRIKAVVLDLAMFTGGGHVTMHDVGAAIDEVRKAKKPVLAYALVYTDDSLQLAAHASEVWVDPMGGAFATGPGGKRLYYKQLIDKFDVNAHIFRVGTHKSAVEPYMRADMSPEARENIGGVYSAIFDGWKGDVAKARPKANLKLVTEDPAGWVKASGGDAAKAAVAAGLADRIGNRVDFGNRVAEVVGKDDLDERPGSFAHTTLRTFANSLPSPAPGKAIGVVTIAGEIVDGEAGPGTAGGDRIAGLLDDALDDNLAGLVVRVDSPGGSVIASERIREAILRHKAKKIPVVVSMANLAASGGYWVSTPADRIFAEPSTITGSIGVFAVIPTFEKTLARYGVTADGIETTPLSGQPDPMGGLTPAVESMLQGNVENIYAQFLSRVAQSRGKTPAEIEKVAEGRVWSGGVARQFGLIDQFGGLEDALAYVAAEAKLGDGDWHASYLGESNAPYASLLARLQPDEDTQPPGTVRDFVGAYTAERAALIAEALAGAERLLTMQGVQAYCLECAGSAPARQGTNPAGWRELLVRWLAPLDR